jgi:NAD-dependent dihydropyrimidine dehydrogenase PreA subunit
MGIFIYVEISEERCVGISQCGRCVEVCPVNVFESGGQRPVTLDENEDECTLCGLCLEACEPKAILIRKLYEETSDTA